MPHVNSGEGRIVPDMPENDPKWLRCSMQAGAYEIGKANGSNLNAALSGLLGLSGETA